MLIHYRKEHQKIAMGLLSFHNKMKKYQSLLKEVHMYEREEKLKLFCWIPENDKNIQGIAGIERLSDQKIVLHDIVINPSIRGERIGFVLLDELKEMHDEAEISGTVATWGYLNKWLEADKTERN